VIRALKNAFILPSGLEIEEVKFSTEDRVTPIGPLRTVTIFPRNDSAAKIDRSVRLFMDPEKDNMAEKANVVPWAIMLLPTKDSIAGIALRVFLRRFPAKDNVAVSALADDLGIAPTKDNAALNAENICLEVEPAKDSEAVNDFVKAPLSAAKKSPEKDSAAKKKLRGYESGIL
jgi:hypothetical protein